MEDCTFSIQTVIVPWCDFPSLGVYKKYILRLAGDPHCAKFVIEAMKYHMVTDLERQVHIGSILNLAGFFSGLKRKKE